MPLFRPLLASLMFLAFAGSAAAVVTETAERPSLEVKTVNGEDWRLSDRSGASRDTASRSRGASTTSA